MLVRYDIMIKQFHSFLTNNEKLIIQFSICLIPVASKPIRKAWQYIIGTFVIFEKFTFFFFKRVVFF